MPSPTYVRCSIFPFERVIISHGDPVHTREAFERALDLPEWPARPLHLAAYRGELDRVRNLVASGADLNARDELYNKIPLDWARSGGDQDVIDYLESLTASST